MSTSSASTCSRIISSVYFSLALLSLGTVQIATVQAEDFLRLNSAVPKGGNTEKYAPAFDFDTDSCLPSAGISLGGLQNEGLPIGGLTRTEDCYGVGPEQLFLPTSNTYHRYACITGIDESNYCAHFYALYFEKDHGNSAGHRHDWEYAAIWTTDGDLTHVSVSLHGNLDTRPVNEVLFLPIILPAEKLTPAIVYHLQCGPWYIFCIGATHSLRFANAEDIANPENPHEAFATPAIASWFALVGDGLNNQEMRNRLNSFDYANPDDGGGAHLPIKDGLDLLNDNTFLNELNGTNPGCFVAEMCPPQGTLKRPLTYPEFTLESIWASNPNNPVLEMSDEGDGTLNLDETGYWLDFGLVHEPLIGNRWLIAELKIINEVFEPADSLDGFFDISGAAPFLASGFNQFTGLVAGDFIDDLLIEFSTSGYGPGVLEGTIGFHPIGLVDTGARELLDTINLKISLEMAPPVDDIVADLPDNIVRTRGNRNALVNFLKQVRTQAQKGNMDQAIKKLLQALERTDGCALRGAPDTRDNSPLAKDYIISCSDQELVYTLINEELNLLMPDVEGGGLAINGLIEISSFNDSGESDLVEMNTQPEKDMRPASGSGSLSLWLVILLLSIRLLQLKRGRQDLH